jgi:hypothetical protein
MRIAMQQRLDFSETLSSEFAKVAVESLATSN